MGSPLSFPILCLLNLLAYKCALERYTGRSWDPRELPCLVNGDDILFQANRSLYDLWLEEIHSVGFKLSPGKNYCSKHFLLINSQMFRIDSTGRNLEQTDEDSGIAWVLRYERGQVYADRLTPIGYTNCGLIFDDVGRISKADDKRHSALELEDLNSFLVSDHYNPLIRGCNDKKRMHRRFMHYKKERIARQTRGGHINLFGPRELGALGCENLAQIPVRYTEEQRDLRDRIWTNLLKFVGKDFLLEDLPSLAVHLKERADNFSISLGSARVAFHRNPLRYVRKGTLVDGVSLRKFKELPQPLPFNVLRQRTLHTNSVTLPSQSGTPTHKSDWSFDYVLCEVLSGWKRSGSRTESVSKFNLPDYDGIERLTLQVMRYMDFVSNFVSDGVSLHF
jgi:hypothetical protein